RHTRCVPPPSPPHRAGRASVRRGVWVGRERRSRRAIQAVAIGLDRVDDLAVSGAAAEVSGEAAPDHRAIVGKTEADRLERAEDDSGRAEAALDAAALDKLLL